MDVNYHQVSLIHSIKVIKMTKTEKYENFRKDLINQT